MIVLGMILPIAKSEAVFSYVPGEDDVLAASSDPYGDHAEPKSVTDHYR